jgi:ABC-type dipeptide/oligopeptide/nickel transport system ATPase component
MSFDYLVGTLECPFHLRPGEVVALIGAPKSGKTAALARIVRRVAEQGGNSIFLCLETNKPSQPVATFWKPYANKIHWITGIHKADDLYVLKKNLEQSGLDPDVYVIDAAYLMAKTTEGNCFSLLAYLMNDLKEFALKYKKTIVTTFQANRDNLHDSPKHTNLGLFADQMFAIKRKDGPQPGPDGLVDQELKVLHGQRGDSDR